MRQEAVRRERAPEERDGRRVRRDLRVASTTPDWLLPDPEPPAPRGPSRAATAWAEGRPPLRAARPDPTRRTVQIRGQVQPPRRRPSVSPTTTARPDRVALWAVVLALFMLFMAVATAHGAPF